jgi:hypothetical protein
MDDHTRKHWEQVADKAIDRAMAQALDALKTKPQFTRPHGPGPGADSRVSQAPKSRLPMRPWNPAAPSSMDEITRFRWQLIADETLDRAFAEAGLDELLDHAAMSQDGGDGELQAADES